MRQIFYFLPLSLLYLFPSVLFHFVSWVKGSGMTIEKIHAEFEVSDKGVGPNRVWYKLTKYVKPQKEAKTNGN